MGTRIRVGLVGANPHQGWAATAHVPALAAAGGYEITAVATTRRESARAAADAFGAPRWFVGAADLAGHPDVDLVVVSVRTTGHADATRAALAAGRHVLVEWPLAGTADDADALAGEAARSAGSGLAHAVAAQVYHCPAARFVADLIAAGRIGTVEAVSFVGSGAPHGGSRVPPYLAWALDPAAGTTLLSIMGGHALAAVDRAVGAATGGLTQVSAVTARLHDRVPVIGTGEVVDNGVAGQAAFVGRFANGAVGSVVLHGGARSGPDGFQLRISGTDGALTVTPREPGEYVNWADWRIRLTPADGDAHDLQVPASFGARGGVVSNLSHLYRDLAGAIAEGRPATPDFHTAARLQHVLAAVERAADTGTRQEVAS